MLRAALFSQSPSFVFSHLGVKDGLSDSHVTCLLKDSRGGIWVGTVNGLNRYDGSHFYVFKKSTGPNSLFNGNIVSLCEDKSGNIWGCTEAGVFCYNPFTSVFRNVVSPKRYNDKSYINILCDSKGNIWATALWSILKYNPVTDSFEEKLVLDEQPFESPEVTTRVNGMLIDSAGNEIWLATRSGLVCYDIRSGRHYDFRNQEANPLFANQNSSALAKSPGGLFWYSNNVTHDIVLFDPEKKTIIRKININSAIPGGTGITMYEDKSHRLWFSNTAGYGLVIDYLKGNMMEKLYNRVEDKISIANGYFYSVFEDEDGALWFATISGISKCNPDKNIYRAYYMPDKIPELKHTSFTIIKEDPEDKNWWLATLDSRVINYSAQTGKYRVYNMIDAIPDKKGRLPYGILGLAPVGNVIVIATTNGTWQLKRGESVIKPFAYFPAELNDFIGRGAVALGDSVCFLTDGQRILRINFQTGKFILYTYPDGVKENEKHRVGFMAIDHQERVWANSNMGRIVHTTGAHQLKAINLVKDEDNEFSGYFDSVEPDKAGNIWVVSTGFGLYRYNPATGDVKYWDQTNGLLSPYVQKSKMDRYDNIWLLTSSNVSVFSPATNDFSHFTIPYAENTINYYNSISRLENGNIIGSIFNDLFEFFPDRNKLVPVKRKPEISLVNVSGKDIMITNQEKLVLKPYENTLRFRFGMLTDVNQFPYQIEYRLEGAEEEWTKSSSINEAIYNNLSPGTYTFRVKARGKNSNWESDEAILLVTIKTPFHKSTWFLLLIGALVFGLIVFIYRLRLKQKEKLMQLETKAQRLEKEKVLVMYENLKQQLNPHFLFNSLTSLSGLIETNQQVAGNFLEQMSGIYRYILKNGDNETVSLKEETEFVRLYINLQQTRFKKGLQVNINVPDDYMHYKIAPVTLQNLIENAIKHNIIDTGSPLVIDIYIEDEYIIVKNNLQKKTNVETSNKKGLAQFVTLYRYLSDKPVLIEESKNNFQVKIPLI